MNRIILVVLLAVILVFSASGQQNEGITIEKKGLKKTYISNGKPVDFKQVSSLLESTPVSAETFGKYRTTSVVGLAFIAAGTLSIGVGAFYTLKSAQATRDNDIVATSEYSEQSGNYMLLGAGLYVVSLPFILISNSNLKKSIELYNSGFNGSRPYTMELYYGFTGEGIGMGLKF